MEQIIIIGIVIVVCISLLARHISKHLRERDVRALTLHEVIYNEARRASRISLECRMTIDRLVSQTRREHELVYHAQEETYKRQEEVILLLNRTFSYLDGVFDINEVYNEEAKTQDILEKIKIRQEYISTAIEKINKIL